MFESIGPFSREVSMRVSTNPLAVSAAVGPFSDLLIQGGREGLSGAADLLAALPALDAVRLVLAASVRFDSVVGDREMVDLAEFLGVYEEDGEEAG
jgi:hypothetical protein